MLGSFWINVELREQSKSVDGVCYYGPLVCLYLNLLTLKAELSVGDEPRGEFHWEPNRARFRESLPILTDEAFLHDNIKLQDLVESEVRRHMDRAQKHASKRKSKRKVKFGRDEVLFGHIAESIAPREGTWPDEQPNKKTALVLVKPEAIELQAAE